MKDVNDVPRSSRRLFDLCRQVRAPHCNCSKWLKEAEAIIGFEHIISSFINEYSALSLRPSPISKLTHRFPSYVGRRIWSSKSVERGRILWPWRFAAVWAACRRFGSARCRGSWDLSPFPRRGRRRSTASWPLSPERLKRSPKSKWFGKSSSPIWSPPTKLASRLRPPWWSLCEIMVEKWLRQRGGGASGEKWDAE